MKDDHGRTIQSAAGIEACFDPVPEPPEAWIPWTHLTDIYHEMCHYFCMQDEKPGCDEHCDDYNEDDGKGRVEIIK